MRYRTVSELPEQMREQAQAQLNASPASLVSVVAEPSAKGERKYDNKPTAGYASAKEARRAQRLRLLEQVGEISGLREQVPFELIPAQFLGGECVERSCSYVADFVYTDAASGKQVVEDAKGFCNRVYRLKRKLMLRVHGIRILET